MKTIFNPTAAVLANALAAAALPVAASDLAGQAGNEAAVLFTTISDLDAAVFDDFNHCADPARLQRHAGYFAEDVEFYHDTGGVTWSRDEMLANTAKYACGNYGRERVEGTFQVHPIKGFGALSLGTHRFCQTATDSCDGLADFTMIWKRQDAGWVITRVLSYGHRSASADSAEASP